MKIVVLNDLHPSQQAGAAGIALQNAQLLASQNEVEYWCTKSTNFKIEEVSEFSLRFFRQGRLKKWAQQKSRLMKVYFEFLDFRLSASCIFLAIRHKPDIVWIHQVGNGFPKSISLVFHMLRIPTVQTLHDYSLLVPGKLFPAHFGWDNSEVDSRIVELENGALQVPMLRASKNLSSIALRFRFKVLRKLLNQNSVNVVVGPQQEKIFNLFGLEKTRFLPNIAEACSCSGSGEKISSHNLRVLFAGRPAGKGLGRICHLIANTDNAHLDLAGNSELLNYLPNDFPSSKFTYLGKIPHSKLLPLLHNYNYVSVLSDCFDVYPSILIEALAHSSRVLCTSTVGNHQLITSEKYGYRISYDVQSVDISIDFIIKEKTYLPFGASLSEDVMTIESYRAELLSIVARVYESARKDLR